MEVETVEHKKVPWWLQRTRFEKCLIVVTALFAILIIYLASNLLMSFPGSREINKKNVCMTDKCISTSAKFLSMMDRKVDPCEDFYNFVCGNFLKTPLIPDHRTSISEFSDASDKVRLQLRTLFEEPSHPNDSYVSKLVKTVYSSCMDTKKIEEAGIDFLKRDIRDLGGWPVIDPNWNEKNFNWITLLERLDKLGYYDTLFYSIYMDIDAKNSSKRLITITQMGMSYDIVKRGFNDSINKAEYDFNVEMSVLFGADRFTALADMKDVSNLFFDLSKIFVPYEESMNESLLYNPMTVRELHQRFPYLPWLKLINIYLAPSESYTPDDVINLALPEYFKKLESFLLTVKKRTIANTLFVHLVRRAIPQLPEIFQKKALDFHKVVYGKQQTSPRWETCINMACRLHIAASSLYVKKYVDKRIKHKVDEMIIDIKSAFLENLKKILWMDKKTRKQAIIKAEQMTAFVGFPDELLDDKLVNEYYQNLQLDPEKHLMKLTHNMSNFFHRKIIRELRRPVIKNDWRSLSFAYIVNAFYHTTKNTMMLPAGIFQGLFYDSDRPQYLNYGALGSIIGHEITHGFDSTGRQYDKDGNVADWWEPESNLTFAKRTQCFVEQYGNITVQEIDTALNGLKTLSENIADNGGVKIAYRGYLRWLERNKNELSLPGLSYTPKQLFWIAAAMAECVKTTNQNLKLQATVYIHAPGHYRANIPLMNSDHFGRDFNCPIGSPMNPKYKCRIW